MRRFSFYAYEDNRDSSGSAAPTPAPTPVDYKTCGWKNTGGCSPTGARQPGKDKGCTAGIEKGASGSPSDLSSLRTCILRNFSLYAPVFYAIFCKPVFFAMRDARAKTNREKIAKIAKIE